MSKQHAYKAFIQWTGNKGSGTKDYQSYERSHTITIENKVDILASSDTPFRGDHTKHNPEDFLLTSLSSCHMLWYLHLCADAGITVVDYIDHVTGILTQTENGSGHFTEVILNPIVTITEESMIAKANELHHKANKMCFIANSVKFKVLHKPVCKSVNQ
jgi:organic hydroperoxide reductase OsmC/OhrA